jgi:hypothetical protein
MTVPGFIVVAVTHYFHWWKMLKWPKALGLAVLDGSVQCRVSSVIREDPTGGFVMTINSDVRVLMSDRFGRVADTPRQEWKHTGGLVSARKA